MKQKLKVLARCPAYVYVWSAALIAIAVVLLVFEHHQLWKIQEQNLFLYSLLYLKEQLVVPGGLLTWVGTWFTQFLYYPWLGVLLLCAWWWLLMAIIKRTFHIADRWAILLLIPVAILLISNMDLGYWIYMVKLRGAFFVSTIGTTLVAALLWGFRSIPDKVGLRAGYILVVCAAGYPLFGIYGLAAALLMAIWSWRLSSSRTSAVVCTVVAILSVAAVPPFCYRYIYYQINLANIYWAELPLFFIVENHPTYYIPYYLLALFFVVLIVTYRIDCIVAKPMKKVHFLLTQAVLALLLVGSVYIFWMKDENFHRELAMQHHIENLDWISVLEEAATQEDEPTRAIVMMRNIALSRIGRQGDDMCFYKNGSKAYAAPFGMRMMLVVGPQVYYHYGLLNPCNRLCIEIGVEFGFRNELYRFLANCAILENDQPLARKYLNILKQTAFYSDWAEQAENLLGHPERIAKDAAREPITHMLHYGNVLASDQGYVERFVMERLVRSTYSDDPIFQEQKLLATLWTKDIRQFWYHFNVYVKQHPNVQIPRHFQEAAYLYSYLEERSDLDKLPVDATIKDSFERFMTAAANYDNKEVSIVRQGLYPFFGETYYYDYYTMRNLPEY